MTKTSLTKAIDDRSAIRVLLVDDDPEMLDILQRLCKKAGFESDIAGSGEEALDMMRKRNYLIVVSDIIMPGCDGIDLLRKIKQLSPPTHVIMLTGYQILENILTAMRAGADTCLFKPLDDPERLKRALLRAADMIQEWRDILSRMRLLKHELEGQNHG